jgi:hypothetical protein
MDDKPLSRVERRKVEKIGFLRRLGIYEPEEAVSEPINWLAANLVTCDDCGLFLGYSPDAVECPNHNQDAEL